MAVIDGAQFRGGVVWRKFRTPLLRGSAAGAVALPVLRAVQAPRSASAVAAPLPAARLRPVSAPSVRRPEPGQGRPPAPHCGRGAPGTPVCALAPGRELGGVCVCVALLALAATLRCEARRRASRDARHELSSRHFHPLITIVWLLRYPSLRDG